MPGSYQYKLSNLEISPPPGSWETIAEKLDTEFNISEVSLAARLDAATLPPPQGLWDSISESLQEESSNNPAKVIPFNFKKLAIAAIATGIFFTAGWFLFRGNDSRDNISGVVQSEIGPATVPEKQITSPEIALNETAVASIVGNVPKMVRVAEAYLRPSSSTVNRVSRVENSMSEDVPETVLQPKNRIRPVIVAERRQVSAPLLRDADGNIIMDINLLKGNSDDYIAVTGPNGEQTKVSAKFLNMLVYMNDADGSQETYLEFLFKRNNGWKQKFSQWREKILEQASFAPSSATFFDVLELRELLKDN